MPVSRLETLILSMEIGTQIKMCIIYYMQTLQTREQIYALVNIVIHTYY